MSFSSMWKLVKQSMKPTLPNANRRRPARTERKANRLWLEILEDRNLLSTVNWVNSAGGDWDTPGNWSTNALPGPTDSVVIDIPGQNNFVVSHSVDSADAVLSVTSNDAINLTRGSLSLATDSTLTNATATDVLSVGGGGFTGAGGGLLTVNGTLTLNGHFTCVYADINGGGTIYANGGMTLGGGTLSNITINNAGLGDTGNASGLFLSYGAVINNQATFNMGSTAIPGTIPVSTFNNSGTFLCSGGGVNTIFNNTGSVEVTAGVESFGGGGTTNGGISSGSFTGDAGTTLLFVGNNNFTSTSSISADQVEFWNNSQSVIAGSYLATGQTSLDSASNVEFSGTVTGLGNSFSVLGFATFDPATPQSLSVGTLSITAGGLTSPDTITVTSQLTLLGFLNGTGTLITSSGCVSSLGGLDGIGPNATFTNGGNAISNYGSIFDIHGTVNNLPGATFVVASYNTLFGGGTFNNQGTFQDSVPATQAKHESVFLNNSGSVEITGGTIGFGYPSGITNSGSIIANPNSTLAFGQNALYTLTPTSTITADNFSAGGLNTVDVQIGGQNPGTGYGQITVGTSATLGGWLQLELVNGFGPYLGEQFTIIHSLGTNPITGTFDRTPLPEGATILVGGTVFQITYQGGANHNDVVLTAIKITPTISWSNPADITYGKALSKTQLDASAAIVTQLNPNAALPSAPLFTRLRLAPF